ncbi:MAG TPA: glycosyltransferase [Spirochaetia bacterium]|nr:glycosyltransferase [Spirochaetia bacterium]
MSGILFVICAALGAGILLVHAVVLFGIFLARRREQTHSNDIKLTAADRALSVSLVVPARNEEALLPRLLTSLSATDLSGIDRFELVIVNDRSTDRTEQIVKEFALTAAWPVQIVQVPDDPLPNEKANPKQRALHFGTVSIKSEIILFTDADCVVGPQWVRQMTLPFRDDRLGLLFGTVMPQGDGGFIRGYQSFDHLFRFYYTAGSAGLGNPTGGFGNNIAVRREALAAVGGFESLRYSVTEDAELIAEVRELHRFQVRPILSPETIVWPEPQHSIGEMVPQSMRWNTGGLYAPDAASRYSYRVVMLFLFWSVVLVVPGIFFPALLLTTAGSFVSMAATAVAAGAISRRPAKFWSMLLPDLLFAMIFYSYITLLTLVHTPIRWKGRVLGQQRG